MVFVNLIERTDVPAKAPSITLKMSDRCVCGGSGRLTQYTDKTIKFSRPVNSIDTCTHTELFR